MIEDDIFFSLVKRSKADYVPATLLHTCEMCRKEARLGQRGYMLSEEKLDTGDPLVTPYLFICNECYDELPE